MDIDLASFGITWPQIGMVLQLAILEGLLSFDNALALAALVSSRLSDPLERKKALVWGIWGAYIFRIGIVFIGVWLMEREWIKLIAGAYLVWLAIKELFFKDHVHENHEEISSEESKIKEEKFKAKITSRSGRKALWQTIIAVELMDIMFSIDSIAVALAVSKERWVLIAGAVLGILMMRIAATYFIRLIQKFPILVPTAFVLVGIAGIKVVLEIKSIDLFDFHLSWIGLHIPEVVFLPVMVFILVGAVILNMTFPKKFEKYG